MEPMRPFRHINSKTFEVALTVDDMYLQSLNRSDAITEYFANAKNEVALLMADEIIKHMQFELVQSKDRAGKVLYGRLELSQHSENPLAEITLGYLTDLFEIDWRPNAMIPEDNY